MGTTTPTLLPYPEPTDLVINGDDVIKALAEQIEAKMPRGVVGFASSQVAQSGITAATDLTGITLTRNLYANRYYRVSAYTLVQGYGASPAILACYIYLDGVVIQQYNHTMGSVNEYQQLAPMMTFTTTTGSHTVKAAITSQLNMQTSPNGRPNWILLEDIGPV